MADFQFGFCKGKCTVDALERVSGIARYINSGAIRRGEFCVLITMDVKDAFNSVPWLDIIRTLVRRKVNPHLVKIIKSYLSDRWLEVGRNSKIAITAGVPQGLVLGPTLWKLYYDELMRLRVPREVTLIGYTDDLVVIISAKYATTLGELANQTMRQIMGWMRAHKLEVAKEKTEAVMLVGRRTIRELTFRVEETEITTKDKIKYLGVMVGKTRK